MHGPIRAGIVFQGEEKSVLWRKTIFCAMTRWLSEGGFSMFEFFVSGAALWDLSEQDREEGTKKWMDVEIS